MPDDVQVTERVNLRAAVQKSFEDFKEARARNHTSRAARHVSTLLVELAEVLSQDEHFDQEWRQLRGGQMRRALQDPRGCDLRPDELDQAVEILLRVMNRWGMGHQIEVTNPDLVLKAQFLQELNEIANPPTKPTEVRIGR